MFDFSQIPTHSITALMIWFFVTIGWIIPVVFFIATLIKFYQIWIRNEYRKTRNYILLAIDIPKNNEQTLKAVENFFAHISGAHMPLKFLSNWWKGEVPDSFSFEIVSIGGYIQFIIHLDGKYRDLVEAAIYAQYPNAEITEIEDYTKRWNIRLPNEKYQLFGGELALAQNEVYPLITYKEFEDQLSGELKDPLAGVLEAMSRINPGEELWFQVVVTPADNDWGDKAKPVINKLIGAKTETKKNFLDYFLAAPRLIVEVLTPATEGGAKSGGSEPPNKVQYMTEGEKNKVKAIQEKIGKIGFHVKIRWIYIAPKELFSPVKAVQSFFGALKQFNLGYNSLKPAKRYFTGGIFYFKNRRLNYRRNIMLFRYKTRGHWFVPGNYGFILNTEELATLWHFPVMTVKAPQMKMNEAKRAEPPSSLPTGF